MFFTLNYFKSNVITRPCRVGEQSKGSFYTLMEVSSWTPPISYIYMAIKFSSVERADSKKNNILTNVQLDVL